MRTAVEADEKTVETPAAFRIAVFHGDHWYAVMRRQR